LAILFKPFGSLNYNDVKPLYRALEAPQRWDRLIIDLADVAFAGPGAMVPVVATVADLRAGGYRVDAIAPRDLLTAAYFERAGWTAALGGGRGLPTPRRGATFVPIVEYTDHETLNRAVTDLLRIMMGVGVYPAGVLKAVEWAINELADNVLLHAGQGVAGWLQAIANPKNGRVNLTVADRGRGILSSLKERFPGLTNDSEALGKAITPGITRDTRIGQGNGLAGSVRIARTMHGWVNIQSGRGELRIMDDGRTFTQKAPAYAGTIVDLTLPTTAEVDLGDALWGHDPVSSIETSHVIGNEIIYRVKDEASGFGNRASGREAANRLANLMTELPRDRIVVDFAGIELISASFADEFLAKLIKRYGVGTFLARVSLANMSSLVARTINAVIAQRLSGHDDAS
jgi:hypothetical protein